MGEEDRNQEAANARGVICLTLGKGRKSAMSRLSGLAGESKMATMVAKIIDHLDTVVDGEFDIRDIKVKCKRPKRQRAVSTTD